jgi:prephenate dehydrogenase
MYKQLGVIGCGLMGGSFALALKQAGLVQQVLGFSKSSATAQSALQLGVIDRVAQSLQEVVTGSDLVLLAVPVSATEATLREVRDRLAPGVLLMDVGSTKCDVIAAAQRALGERMASFVPAHPIAGKESAGVAHAEASLYQGRQLILTPLPQTDGALLQQARELWSAIGSTVLEMSAAQHDAAFAAVSHLPHLLAFAYFQSIADQAEGSEFLSLAGPGFRDFTRIAASDANVWRDILLSNKAEVLQQSQRFRQALDALEQLMREDDAAGLTQTLRETAEARSLWQMGAPRRAR